MLITFLHVNSGYDNNNDNDNREDNFRKKSDPIMDNMVKTPCLFCVYKTPIIYNI
jgi:hypothetical protein